ncbi:MAG: hypothetical protein GX952_03340 [Firmicutes bacterium]|nr:hypothetical protein [Bacillota bacterium]
MRTRDPHWLLILSALVGLALMVVIPNNISIGANNRVGLALDWQEVQGVALAAGVSPAQLVQRLRSEGISYLVLREDTLGRLKQTGRIQILTGWELRQLSQMLGQADGAKDDLPGRDTYILTTQRELYERVKQRLNKRFPGQVRSLTWEVNNVYVLALPEPPERLNQVGIGLAGDDIAAVKAMGLKPVLAWLDGTKSADELKLDLQDAASVQPEILLPGPLAETAQEQVGAFLARLDIIQAVPEFDPPPGIAPAVAASGYKAVRVYERPPHTIYQEYALAVRDRNVRFLILHLFWQVPAEYSGQTLLAANVAHIRRVAAAATGGAIRLGQPKQFEPRPANPLLVAAMLSLTPALFINWRQWPRLPWLSFCLGIGLIALVGPPRLLMLLRKGLALMLAGLLPVKAMFTTLIWADKRITGTLKRGLMVLMVSSGLTLVGGIAVQGLLGDIGFLLKLEAFSGIKAAYLITFFSVLATAYKKLWLGDRWWAEKQITPLELVVLASLMLLVWVLFNRSGNMSIIPIPTWELKARAWLESNLYARPRTKEFLLGHPALMLAAAGWAQNKFYRPYLLVLAAVGQASLINTFVHLHTPVVVSLVRSILGLLGGALLGTVIVGTGNFVARRGKRNA